MADEIKELSNLPREEHDLIDNLITQVQVAKEIH